MSAGTSWRLLVDRRPGSGARHMATDAALLESVGRGASPVLRFYRWSPPCLSFGRNERAVGVYAADRVRARGFDVVRRPTGGHAVLHDREVTYAVVAPIERFGGLRRAYIAVNEALVAGLCRLGVPAVLALPTAAARAEAGPIACFDIPAAGEVMAAGRKLVGSAQRREGRALLQHGSILLDGSQAVIRDLRAVQAPPPVAHATLREVLGSAPRADAVAAAIVAGFGDCGIRLAPATLSPGETERANVLIERFDDDAWTWRR